MVTENWSEKSAHNTSPLCYTSIVNEGGTVTRAKMRWDKVDTCQKKAELGTRTRTTAHPVPFPLTPKYDSNFGFGFLSFFFFANLSRNVL